MAVATSTAILIGLGAAGAGFAVSKAISKPTTPKAPIALPQSPDPQTAVDRASETIRRKRDAMTKSIYTSPLGVQGQARIAKKTLLGQ